MTDPQLTQAERDAKTLRLAEIAARIIPYGTVSREEFANLLKRNRTLAITMYAEMQFLIHGDQVMKLWVARHTGEAPVSHPKPFHEESNEYLIQAYDSALSTKEASEKAFGRLTREVEAIKARQAAQTPPPPSKVVDGHLLPPGETELVPTTIPMVPRKKWFGLWGDR
jgi:hypothetical protein